MNNLQKLEKAAKEYARFDDEYQKNIQRKAFKAVDRETLRLAADRERAINELLRTAEAIYGNKEADQ